MPCFYCGKRVSRVRQINDADFCSDEHRERFHALTRSAFNRLLESPERTAAPVVHPEVEYPAGQRRHPTEVASVAQEPATRSWEHSQPKAARAFEMPPAVDHFAACRLEPMEAEKQPEFAEPELSLLDFQGNTSEPAQDTLGVRLSASKSAEDTIEAIARRMPEMPLIVARPGPLSSTCSVEAALTSGGRALPRPILPRFPPPLSKPRASMRQASTVMHAVPVDPAIAAFRSGWARSNSSRVIPRRTSICNPR